MNDTFKQGHFSLAGSRKNLIGPRLRSIRKEIRPKVSQDDLSGRLASLGITLDRSAISRIENQDRAINDVEIVAISRALGIKVEKFFEGLTYRQWSDLEALGKVAED